MYLGIHMLLLLRRMGNLHACQAYSSRVAEGTHGIRDTFSFCFPLKQPVPMCIICRCSVLVNHFKLCCASTASQCCVGQPGYRIRSCPLLLAASYRRPSAIFRKDLPEGCRQRERSSSRYLTSVVQPALDAAVLEVWSPAALPALLLDVLPALPGWSRPLLATRKEDLQKALCM